MAIQITCRELSKTYGVRPLFQGLTFGLSDGERTGLIGRNGTGKSTLLKILAGLETPDTGELAPRRGLRVGYLAQQSAFENAAPGLTVRGELLSALGGAGLEQYELDILVENGMARAGFADPEQPVASLSGGWRKRLAILEQVLKKPDLFLLDEPTNHLDLEGVLWLEDFMSNLEFAFLVVTHDRRFLERVCNRVIELDKRYPQGHFSSAGNYSRFLEKREELFAAQAAQEESARNIVRREIEWLRRGPKARTTKQKARIDRAGELMQELSELEYRNSQTRTASIDFSATNRRTKKLAECRAMGKSLGGKRLFSKLDLTLHPGDKLGLLGANGSGKSTLLGAISGDIQPDEGTVTRADQLKIVRFDQHREQLDLSLTLRRALCEKGDFVIYKEKPLHIAAWAGRFLFGKEQLETPLAELSGGEQARVLIARLMLKPADVLLLDEPTNDLDLNSLEVLEESLAEFAGALVLVTHDRYLMDRVCGRILALDGRGGNTFYADLEQWEDRTAERRAEETSAPAQKQPAAEEKPALSKKEQKELSAMHNTIREAEEQAEKARAALEDPSIATDAAELHKRHEKYEEARRKVDGLYARWEELENLKTAPN
ncbi:MAG: ABC-F family ATP-binding cassette domain-containing protein [Elusimicrobia bacterium]|nr:ABC-F family ATP-binding cassette domain-containing protein [Elusimicrobiota bacterium]